MRKGHAKKRILAKDPKYQDPLVTRFVNGLMYAGKKSLAYAIFYKALDKVAEKSEEDGLALWKKALENIMPMIEVKRKRIGGATLQIPIEVRQDRKVSLGIKWFVSSARARNERTMVERLANETLAAAQGEGNAMKKKQNMHKMAESNRAFSHFRI